MENEVVEWLLNFIIGVVSSIVATILCLIFRKEIRAFLAAMVRVRALWSQRGRVLGSQFVLTTRATLTSFESIKLLGWTSVIFASIFGLLMLPFLFQRHSLPRKVKRVGLGTWTYRVVHEDLFARTLTIARNGLDVYSTSASLPSLITFQADGTVSINELFTQDAAAQGKLVTTDITGDTVPDILLVSSCGCSGGYTDYHLLSLDDEVTETFTVENEVGMWEFADRDGDRIPEIITREEVGDSDSLTPITIEMVLKYDNGKLKLATDLMKTRAPSERELLRKVAKDKRQPRSSEGVHLDYAYIAELVFGGNGELARRYLDLVLADEPQNERAYFWSLYFEDMARSEYWEEIAELNRWSPDQYAFKECPY